MSTLMLYRHAFTTLGTDHKWGHSFALATNPDGTVVVYCDNCDTDQHDPTDKRTHCCPNESFVCDDCSRSDWWTDICEDRWFSYMERHDWMP